MIFESHAHYDDEAFDEDRDGLLSSFEGNNILKVINVASSTANFAKTREISHGYKNVYSAYGIHPEEACKKPELTGASGKDALVSLLEEALRDEKAVAVGEIGLDYYWDKDNAALQKEMFARQLDLAHDRKLPFIVHSREAARDTLDILRGQKPERGVIHCFSYSKEIAAACLDMGYYIGVGGVVTFGNARKLVEVVKYVPLEYILIETDSPYLAPTPNRGKRNSSLNLKYIIEKIAAIKDTDPCEVEEITFNNARKLFLG